ADRRTHLAAPPQPGLRPHRRRPRDDPRQGHRRPAAGLRRAMRGALGWLPTILLLPAAAILLWIGYTGDVSSLLLGLLALVLAWWFSPRHGSDATHASVTTEPLEHPVVIYWRPGCLYCARLRAALGSRGRTAAWVNI